ncbi:MAG TPA: UDP-galactose-lipid carrier transferase [Gammaproteobacteria bacterium]|nr:UDP-galactose-lipid carrier transferase [Gammaproteobacteria bacterium]
MLESLDVERKLDKADYKDRLKAWQMELVRLQQSAMRRGVRAMVALEGMDAAGKGGAIRRLVRPLDPRGFRVYRVGPPAREERERHHLYRFWTKVPLPGELAVFDRSWYGRVLVERVEGLAGEDQWQRAYREINDFERTLADAGVALVKCWLHIDADEQLERFEARLADPLKAWKMSDDDWRNRANWDAYQAAAEDALARTDTEAAPWTLIPANHKRYARIAVLQAVARAIRARAEAEGLECPPFQGRPLD